MRPHSKRVGFLIKGGLCLVTVLFYKDTLSTYFLGDDLSFLYHIADQARRGQLVTEWLREVVSPPHRGGFFYRPFVDLSFSIDYVLWGTNSAGWHLTNLLLHLANILLLWRFVECVAGRSSDRASMVVGGAAAAIFALRPSAPETVVWLSGRNDELVLIGFFIALLAYLQAEGRWGGSYLLAIGGFLFALGSKEAGVTLPGALLALHLSGALRPTPKVDERPWLAWFRQTLKGVGPFALILVIYFIWRFFLFGTPFAIYREVVPIELDNPIWQVAKLHALGFFLAPSLEVTYLSASFFIAVILQALIGFFAAWRFPLARRVWVFGICWLMAVLFPLAQQLFITPTGEGARLLYIPGAVLAVVLAAPLATLLERSWRGRGLSRPLCVGGAVGIALVLLLSVPLLKDLLQPWLEAGESMKALPAAIATRAEGVPGGGFAILLVPDHYSGALFARNGQGALMEPPVQRQSLSNRVLVLTPPTAGQHAPRYAMLPQQGVKLEHWCWNLKGWQFERLHLREHGPDEWRDAWKTALRCSGCSTLAHELEALYR